MTDVTAITRVPLAAQGNLEIMGQRLHVDPLALQGVLLATVFRDAGPQEFAALILVANTYKLNPLLKEIYAFKDRKSQAIVPIVSIDGWIRIINEHPAFDGMEFEDIADDKGQFIGMECTIYRKDRQRPVKIIEWLAECKQDTVPWKTVPRRMTRHRSLIQCARYAFGFSGIYAEDDVEALGVQADLQRDNVLPKRTAIPMTDGEGKAAASGAVDADPVGSVVQGISEASKEILASNNDFAERQPTPSIFTDEPQDGEGADADDVANEDGSAEDDFDPETGEVPREEAKAEPAAEQKPVEETKPAAPTEINGVGVPTNPEEWAKLVADALSSIKIRNTVRKVANFQEKYGPLFELATPEIRKEIDDALNVQLAKINAPPSGDGTY